MEGHKIKSLNSATLLWPDFSDRSTLVPFIRPYNSLLTADQPATTSEDLLWPAQLINAQARLQKRKDWSRLPATLAFCLSILLCIAVGPTQLALIAIILDYNWVTTVYYPHALHYVLPLTSLVAILSILALVLAWRSQPKYTRLTAVLVAGSLAELCLIWLSGCINTLAPHTFTLTALVIAAITIIVLLFLSKQYTPQRFNSSTMHASLTTIGLVAIATLGFNVYYLTHATTADPVQLEQLATAQAQARQEGVSEMLSDLTYTLCGESYQSIYLSTNTDSGLFECTKSHEVYSVQNPSQQNSNSIRGYASYLGTTYNADLSLAFPNSYYLYRSMPDSLHEAELVLMVPMSSDRELIDNIAQPLLDYWNTHNQESLFLNVFYALTLDTITSTKDYILMTAVGTMAKASHLPHEDVIYGYHDGNMLNYIFQPDNQLAALNELGADPSLYSAHTRDALNSHKHISIHLPADTTYDLDTFREMLQSSLTGGL